MPIEFLGMGATNDGSETRPRTGPSFDRDYTVRLARAHEETGWDRVLTAYSSASPDPAQAAAYIACHTEQLQLLLAHRPNLSIPTFAAKTVATLDQISDGRLTLHVITGGNDHDERYSRTLEYIQILKQAWTSHEVFDHHGPHYDFDDFVLDVFPVRQPHPEISFGGSSDAAYDVGAAVADTAEQIATIRARAAAAGRTTPPRIQVAFRPILGPTEEAAWDKAHQVVETIARRRGVSGSMLARRYTANPE